MNISVKVQTTYKVISLQLKLGVWKKVMVMHNFAMNAIPDTHNSEGLLCTLCVQSQQK